MFVRDPIYSTCDSGFSLYLNQESQQDCKLLRDKHVELCHQIDQRIDENIHASLMLPLFFAFPSNLADCTSVGEVNSFFPIAET